MVKKKILATIQNMIDKSLGKQPLADNSSSPKSNVVGTFQHNATPPESSAAHVPQYGMPLNYYDGQKAPEQYSTNRAFGPASQAGQTGYEGPVLVL